jgi:hypothetical protein
LRGANFGVDTTAVIVLWNGESVSGVRVAAPHTALTFTSPSGPGGPVSLEVTVGGQPADLGGRRWSLAYRPPIFRGLSLEGSTDPFECSRSSAIPVTGGNATLQLLGSDFGNGSATTVCVPRCVWSLLRPLWYRYKAVGR